MDENKILSILEQLSQNILYCHLSYIDKTRMLSGTEITGNNITIDNLKEEFNQSKVGTLCTVSEVRFQPKNKNFIVTIKDNRISCSKYANKNESKEIINTITKMYPDCISIEDTDVKYTISKKELVKLIGTRCNTINENILGNEKNENILNLCKYKCNNNCPYNKKIPDIINDISKFKSGLGLFKKIEN